MESHGIGGQIQVTEDVVRRLDDRFEFEERGAVPVKGKGRMNTYWLIGKKEIPTAVQTDKALTARR